MHLSASSIIGDEVKNIEGENLGDIEDLMIETDTGKVDYAVLTFGGIFGVGSKLFAIPLEAMTLNPLDKSFTLNVSKDRLENAPGFDKDKWPDTADPVWQKTIRDYYHLS